MEGGASLALEENGLRHRKDTFIMSLLPKASLSLAILAGLGLATAHPANAQVLYAQPYNGVSFSGVSQVVPDLPKFTTYCFDDFTVTGARWDISRSLPLERRREIPG